MDDARTLILAPSILYNLWVENISACRHCKTAIELRDFGGGSSYCGGCGKPFPWTEIALLAAKEYTDELDQLSPEEKTVLKNTFDDLVSDTARTPLAASRFKKFMVKAGPIAQAALTKMFDTVVTEATQKLMGLWIAKRAADTSVVESFVVAFIQKCIFCCDYAQLFANGKLRCCSQNCRYQKHPGSSKFHNSLQLR